GKEGGGIVLRFLVSRLLRLRIIGLDRLTFLRPTVIMANHVSFFDALLLALLLPKNVCFLINTAIAKKLGWFAKLRHTVAIDPQNPYAIREMVKLVRSGVPLVIFPEGRITVTGSMMKMYAGAAFIAVKSEADVYPVWIDGLQYSRWSRMHNKWPLQTFPRVRVTIGASMRLPIERGVPMRTVKERAVRMLYDALQSVAYDTRKQTNVNLYNIWLDTAKKHPHMPIVEDVNGVATYKKLVQGATALSLCFDKIVTKDVVGVLLPNVNAHIATLFALFRIGKSPAMLNFSLGVRHMLEHCDVASLRNVITSRAFVEKAQLAAAIDAMIDHGLVITYLEDVRASLTIGDKLRTLLLRGRRSKHAGRSVILFTSGSEGRSKGVVLSHDNIFANVQQARLMIDSTQQDKIMNALPLFHSFGLTAGTMFPLLCGIPIYTYPSPLHYKTICELIYDRNCTILFGTSTFLAGYARAAHPYDFRSLRYVFAGAEKLSSTVQATWNSKFGIRILEGYGTTEAAPIVSLNTPLFAKQGTVGRPVPGLRVRIEPIDGIAAGGKLLLQGDQMMRGYLIHDRGFVPNEGWYDTGDVVTIDDEGFIAIQARLKRFAKIAGEMISLDISERIVLNVCTSEQPSAAVVCISDARKGERLIAYTTEPIDPTRVRDALQKQQLSPLFAPSAYETIEAIPLLGSGKTDYVTLTKRAQTKYGS
ncbi:MAG: AMP-binding protein, partial [Paenibacillaceae bacterium]|nr:AMP-binding protein [Paenibacillaceae bacterium]